MLRRAPSSGAMMYGVACALVAAAAVSIDSPAKADCIVQPNQQVPEGAHWSLHYDRAKNRRCWVLVDAAGRDLSAAAQPESTTTPTISAFQAILGNFTGAGSPPPAQEAPAVAPAQASPPPARRPPARVSANRPEHVRTERAEPRDKGDAAKHELTTPEREALFEEFLRWHESQQMIGTVKPSPR